MRFLSNKKNLDLVSCGYLRKYFNTKNMNPKDIAKMIALFLAIDWTFDYFFDSGDKNNGLTIHGIENDGTTLKCNYKRSGNCACFFCSYSSLSF